MVGLAGIALGVSLAGDASLYAILPSQPQVVGVSLGAVGLLLSVNRLVRLAFNPLSGLLSDSVGRRRPYVVGLLLGTLSTATYAGAHGLVPMLGARTVWGASWALVLVGAYSMLMDVASPHSRGLLSGLLQIAYFLGAAFGMVGACLSDVLGFRPAMLVCAGITSVGVVAALGLPETTPRREPPVRPHPRRSSRNSWRALAAINGLYSLSFFCANGVFYSTLGRFLKQGWGTVIPLGGKRIGVASLTGVLLLIRSMMGLVGAPLGGRLSDRIGRWPVTAACAFLAGFGFLGLASGRVIPALAGGAALLLSIPAMIAILAALVGDRSHGNRYGAAFGGLTTCGDAGAAAGPLLAYKLLSSGISLPALYTGCAVMLLGTGLGAAIVALRETGTSSL